MENVDALIRNDGRVLDHYDADGNLSHVAFASPGQISTFSRIPEVLCIDGTHNTNRERYILYQFVATDGLGYGRTVLYAFIRQETYESMVQLFTMFREIMGALPCSRMRTCVLDKMASQMKAVRDVFHCEIRLCYFHLRQAIRHHTTSSSSRNVMHLMATRDTEVEFNSHLQGLRRSDPRFLQYLLTQWVPIKRLWAVHAQSCLLTLGNTTNNRVESSHGRLKKKTNHRDSLVVAIQKVLSYSQSLVSDYALQASYGCDRHASATSDEYLDGLLRRLTVYAAQRLLRHLKGVIPTLTFEMARNRKFQVNQGGHVFEVDASTGSCDCQFYETLLLPCAHLLSVFRGSGEGFDAIPVAPRWLAEFNSTIDSERRLVCVHPDNGRHQKHVQEFVSFANEMYRDGEEKGDQWLNWMRQASREKFPPSTSTASERQPQWNSPSTSHQQEPVNFPRRATNSTTIPPTTTDPPPPTTTNSPPTTTNPPPPTTTNSPPTTTNPPPTTTNPPTTTPATVMRKETTSRKRKFIKISFDDCDSLDDIFSSL